MKFLDGENEKLETSFEWIRMNGRPDIHLLLANVTNNPPIHSPICKVRIEGICFNLLLLRTKPSVTLGSPN